MNPSLSGFIRCVFENRDSLFSAIIIKGRAKRFAKIAGEMVSLAAVEEIAGDLWPEHLSAVAAIKDERKGERLVLITDCATADRAAFLAHAKARGAQDLMVPAEVVPAAGAPTPAVEPPPGA